MPCSKKNNMHVRLKTTIGEDRKLVVELPPNMPVGQVELVVRSLSVTNTSVRDQLTAQGALITDIDAPDDAMLLSDDDLLALTTHQPSNRSVLDDVNEDRNER